MNPSHFGFEFGSSYDECFKIAKERFGDEAKKGFTKNFAFNTKTESIYFVANFSGYKALNTLLYTPKTKKLYQISHKMPLPKGDEGSSERIFMILHFENELKKKYGNPMPINIKGIPRDLALAKGIPAIKGWAVKDEGITIYLTVRNEVRGQDNELVVSYSDSEMGVLETMEHNAINKETFEDL